MSTLGDGQPGDLWLDANELALNQSEVVAPRGSPDPANQQRAAQATSQSARTMPDSRAQHADLVLAARTLLWLLAAEIFVDDLHSLGFTSLLPAVQKLDVSSNGRDCLESR